jgi:hypothetical protein
VQTEEDAMPAVSISRWDRRDSADRVDLHGAALAFTKAVRAGKGVLSSRFYWELNGDAVVVITEYETVTAMMAEAAPAVPAAAFRLADLGRPTGMTRLTDARDAAATYQAAGRA